MSLTNQIVPTNKFLELSWQNLLLDLVCFDLALFASLTLIVWMTYLISAILHFGGIMNHLDDQLPGIQWLTVSVTNKEMIINMLSCNPSLYYYATTFEIRGLLTYSTLFPFIFKTDTMLDEITEIFLCFPVFANSVQPLFFLIGM